MKGDAERSAAAKLIMEARILDFQAACMTRDKPGMAQARMEASAALDAHLDHVDAALRAGLAGL